MGTTNEVRQMRRRAELRGEESGTRKRMGEEGGQDGGWN